jgi:O-antigen/teichoic acid export membrane protein
MSLTDVPEDPRVAPSERPVDASSPAVSGDAEDSVGYRDPARTGGVALRSGLAWTLAGQWAGYATQLIVTAVLARLVAPRDFGILSEALTLTAFATQLQTLGLSQAVIQRARLTQGQMSNLFWVNVVTGLVLCLLVIASAPLVASFYGNHALVGVSVVLSLTFLIAGFGVQHSALMARRMNFRAIALRSLTPRILGGGVAIVAAVLGAGYWALVLQQVVGMFFTVLFVWTAIDWRPGKPTRRTGVRPLLRFGAGVSVANLAYYFSGNSDNILVGRFLGAGPLGLYARAYNLFLVPLRQIHGPLGNVVQPVMAAIADKPERYRKFYRRTLSSICIVGMPGVVFLAVMSRSIITVVLGKRWLGAADPFSWLAIAGFLQMISRTFSWLFTTSGRSRAMAKWALFSSPMTVGSFAIGLHWGITGVAASYAIVQSILIVPAMHYAVKDTPVSMTDVVSAVWRSVVIAGAVGGAALVVNSAAASWSAAAVLAAAGAAAVLCWLGLVVAWPSVRNEVKALGWKVRRR